MNISNLSLDCPANILIRVCIHIWGKSGLDTDLCCTQCSCLSCTSYYFVCWQKISLFFTKVSTECTKTTLLYAYIGKVDVSIYYVCYNVSNSSFSELICNHSNKVKIKPLCMK